MLSHCSSLLAQLPCKPVQNLQVQVPIYPFRATQLQVDRVTERDNVYQNAHNPLARMSKAVHPSLPFGGAYRSSLQISQPAGYPAPQKRNQALARLASYQRGWQIQNRNHASNRVGHTQLHEIFFRFGSWQKLGQGRLSLEGRADLPRNLFEELRIGLNKPAHDRHANYSIRYLLQSCVERTNPPPSDQIFLVDPPKLVEEGFDESLNVIISH